MSTFQDPFARSLNEGLLDGKYQGYLRGWRVFTLTDVEGEPGWGVEPNKPRLTICYRDADNVLGIAVRYDTGETREENTLVTFRSMYSTP